MNLMDLQNGLLRNSHMNAFFDEFDGFAKRCADEEYTKFDGA